MKLFRIVLVVGIIAASLINALAVPHLAYAQGGGTLTLSGSALHDAFTGIPFRGCATVWDGSRNGFIDNPTYGGGSSSDYCGGSEPGYSFGVGAINMVTFFSTPTFITNVTITFTELNLFFGGFQNSARWKILNDDSTFESGSAPSPLNHTIGLNPNVTNSGVNIFAIADDADIVVTEVDITYTGPPPSLATIPPGGTLAGGCQMCVYAPTGDWFQDAPKLVAWLYCQIQNLFACWLIPVLLGIWQSILDILHVFAWFQVWVGDEVNIAGVWVNSNVLVVTTWLNGELNNVVTGITNGLYLQLFTITSNGGASFWDVLVSLFNNLGGVLQSFLNGLPSIIHEIAGVIIDVINNIVQLALVLITIIVLIINFGIGVLNEIIGAMGILPAIVGTFIDGFNIAAHPISVGVGNFIAIGGSSPPSNSLDCTDPIVFHFCTALYTLDNTVFAGDPNFLGGIPILAVGVLLMLGLFIVQLLLWIVEKFRDIFSEA